MNAGSCRHFHSCMMLQNDQIFAPANQGQYAGKLTNGRAKACIGTIFSRACMLHSKATLTRDRKQPLLWRSDVPKEFVM